MYSSKFLDTFDYSHRLTKSQQNTDKINNSDFKDKMEITQSEGPDISGYIVRIYYGFDPPLEPFDPINPFNPFNPNRRPVPKRPFQPQQIALQRTLEQLTDVFDDKTAIKIYLEAPGENKDDIHLNVTADKAEIKTRHFYKIINLPPNDINIQKASSQYKNGVLEIVIPKKTDAPEAQKMNTD